MIAFDHGAVTIVRGKIAELVREPLLAPCEEARGSSRSFVAGRTLLRRMLGRWLDRDPRPIALVEVPDEKPRLAHGDLGFNVVHGGAYVLVALARGRNIGVDVEPIDPRRPVTAIAEEAIGPDAAFELEHLPAERRAARFTSWWVRIEALCKATGAGLMFPRSDEAPPAGYTVRDLAMPPGYHAAVAFDGGAPTRLTTLDWSAG